MTDFDEAIEYHEAQLDVTQHQQTPDEMREFIIGHLALEYTRCVATGVRDERAWNRLSKWLYRLTEIEDQRQAPDRGAS